MSLSLTLSPSDKIRQCCCEVRLSIYWSCLLFSFLIELKKQTPRVTLRYVTYFSRSLCLFCNKNQRKRKQRVTRSDEAKQKSQTMRNWWSGRFFCFLSTRQRFNADRWFSCHHVCVSVCTVVDVFVSWCILRLSFAKKAKLL